MSIRVLIWISIIFSPLNKGGTPRLSLFILQILALTILFISLYSILKSKKIKFSFTVTEILFFMFLIISAISSSLRSYQHDAQRCLILIISFIIFYLHITEKFKLKNFKRLWWGILCLGIFESLIGLYQIIIHHEYRVFGTFLNPNHLAAYLSCLTILLLSKIILDKSFRNALWLKIPIIVLFVVVLLLTRSRGGILSLTGGLILITALIKRARKKALMGLVLCIILLILIPNPFINRIKDIQETDIYAYSRLSMWTSAARMIKDHPLFGVGLGNFRYFTQRYAFPVEGAWARYAKVANYAHNEPLQLTAELGIPGMIFFLLSILTIINLTFNLKGDKERLNNQKYPIFIGIMTLLIHSLVDFIFHLPPLIFLLIFLIAWIRQINIENNIQKPYFINISQKGLYTITLLLFIIHLICGLIVTRQYIGYFYSAKADGQNLYHDIKNIKKATCWDFNCAPYHNSLGGAYFKIYGNRKDPYYLGKGIGEAKLAQILNPEDHHFPLSLGMGYLNLYEHMQKKKRLLNLAQIEFENAIKLAPYFYQNYLGLGRALLYQKQFVQAKQAFEKVIGLEPNSIAGHNFLYLIYEILGNKHLAKLEKNKISEIKGMGLEKRVQNDYERALISQDTY